MQVLLLLCKSLASLPFESNSKLHRIETFAFAESGLTILALPNSIGFLSGSAFVNVSLDSISFWPGQCEFQVHEMFIEDIAGRSLIRYFGRSTAVVIESRIEIVGEFCFSNGKSLASITIESNSKLPRIEACAFAQSGLTAIRIPASVVSLCKSCFYKCKSVESIFFTSNLQLHRIDESAFAESGLVTIQIPASIVNLCNSCFYKCKSFTSLPFESNSKLHRIDTFAFAESGFTRLALRNSIHFLSGSAFANRPETMCPTADRPIGTQRDAN
jgi:hypothetical protein